MTTLIHHCSLVGCNEYESGWSMTYSVASLLPRPWQVAIHHSSGEIDYGDWVDTPRDRLLVAAFLASLNG